MNLVFEYTDEIEDPTSSPFSTPRQRQEYQRPTRGKGANSSPTKIGDRTKVKKEPYNKVKEESNWKIKEEPGLRIKEEPGLKVKEEPGLKIKGELEAFVQEEAVVRNTHKRGASAVSEGSPLLELPEVLNLTGDIPDTASYSMCPMTLRPRRQKRREE